MSIIDDTNKRKRGRPPVDTEAVNLRLPRDVLDAVERYRLDQPEPPTRPEALRRMVADWLRERGYLKD